MCKDKLGGLLEGVKGAGVSAAKAIKGMGVGQKIEGKQSFRPFRTDLLYPKALLGMSRVMHEGCERHDECGWGDIPAGVNVARAIDHLLAYSSGDRSNEHLLHALCRTMFAFALEDGFVPDKDWDGEKKMMHPTEGTTACQE